MGRVEADSWALEPMVGQFGARRPRSRCTSQPLAGRAALALGWNVAGGRLSMTKPVAASALLRFPIFLATASTC